MLPACNKEAKEPVTADKVVAEAGELAQPLPGQYETRVKLLEFSVPGLPPSQADRIKAMMGNVGGETTSYCLTPEEAKKGFDESVRKMTEGQGGMKCEFSRFDVDGGKLAAEMTCNGQQGMTSTLKLDGTADCAEHVDAHGNDAEGGDDPGRRDAHGYADGFAPHRRLRLLKL